jgi:hypothetical protein
MQIEWSERGLEKSVAMVDAGARGITTAEERQVDDSHEQEEDVWGEPEIHFRETL